MGNEIEVKKDNLPTAWKDEMAQYAQSAAALVRPSASYISLKSGIMQYQGQPIPNNKLEVLILDFAFENTLYLGKYDPGNISSPDCFALSQDPNDIAPHELAEGIPVVDGVKVTACVDCPNLKWGSKEGSRGKACQERRRLLMVAKNSAVDADTLIAAEVAIMKVPVMSVRNWDQYVQTVAGMYQRPPFGVITELSTAPDAKSQFRVVFKTTSEVSPELWGAIKEKRRLAQTVLLKPYERSDDEEEVDPKKAAKDKKYAK